MTRHDGIVSQRSADPGCVPEDDGFMHELAPCGDVRRAVAARISVASLSAEGVHISVGCWPFAAVAILCRKNAGRYAPSQYQHQRARVACSGGGSDVYGACSQGARCQADSALSLIGGFPLECYFCHHWQSLGEL